MADEMVYRGFVIRAEPVQLQSGGWTLEGYLTAQEESGARRTRIAVDGTTPSRAGAVRIVFARGKQLADARLEQDGSRLSGD